MYGCVSTDLNMNSILFSQHKCEMAKVRKHQELSISLLLIYVKICDDKEKPVFCLPALAQIALHCTWGWYGYIITWAEALVWVVEDLIGR